MNQTPFQKRIERRERNKAMVDLNLVSLIDIFTILIFFLLANSSDVDLMANTKGIKLPESVSEKPPKETVVISVSAEDIIIDGRKIASVPEVLASDAEVIDALRTELDYQATRSVIDKAKRDATAKDITILGDRQIPYRLLKKIIVTCATANYGNVSFAVTKKQKG
jgi:biopolymer transport protein ExbD